MINDELKDENENLKKEIKALKNLADSVSNDSEKENTNPAKNQILEELSEKSSENEDNISQSRVMNCLMLYFLG